MTEATEQQSAVQSSKTCASCKIVKLFSEFSRCAARSDGLQIWCRGCKSEAQRKYRKDEPDKRRALEVNYRKLNREKINKQQSNRYFENPEPIKKRAKAYRDSNSFKVLAIQKKHRAKYIEDIRKKKRDDATILSDRYIKDVLSSQGIPAKVAVSLDLVNLKREQLTIHRLSQQLKKASHESLKDPR